MDKKNLKKIDDNLNWLIQNGMKLNLIKWFEKLYQGVDITTEELNHFSEVITSKLTENKAIS